MNPLDRRQQKSLGMFRLDEARRQHCPVAVAKGVLGGWGVGSLDRTMKTFSEMPEKFREPIIRLPTAIRYGAETSGAANYRMMNSVRNETLW